MIINLSGKMRSGKDTAAQIIQYLVWRKRLDNPHLAPISENHFKEFCNSILVEHSGIKVKHFAHKIKEIIAILTGCTVEDLYDEEFKDKELNEEWWYYANRDIPGECCITSYLNSDVEELELSWLKVVLVKPTYRKLLQLLGTEAGRNIIHPDIWINALYAEYTEDVGYSYPIQKLKDNEDGSIECKVLKDPKRYNHGYPNWIIADNRFPNEIERGKQHDSINFRIERPINLRFPELWEKYQNHRMYIGNEGNAFLKWLSIEDPKQYAKITHPSETSLDNYTGFIEVIDNDGSLLDLIHHMDLVLTKHNLYEALV